MEIVKVKFENSLMFSCNKKLKLKIMKRINILLIVISTVLVACSGSDVYRGAWKGVGINGAKVEINFEPKNFTVVDSTGGSTNYTYVQKSVNIENSKRTYGITLGDGRNYQIVFPISESQGFISDENGNVLFSINRTDYVSYDDIYKLK